MPVKNARTTSIGLVALPGSGRHQQFYPQLILCHLTDPQRSTSLKNWRASWSGFLKQLLCTQAGLKPSCLSLKSTTSSLDYTVSMLPGSVGMPTLFMSLFIVIIQSCNSRTGLRGRQLYKSQKTHLTFDLILQTFRSFSTPMLSMSNCFKGSSTRETLFSLVAVLTWTGSSLVA